MSTYVIQFAANAFFPLLLAGYCGYLAVQGARVKIAIICGLTVCSVMSSGVAEFIAFRSDRQNDSEQVSRQATQEKFQQDVLLKLNAIINEPDTPTKKEQATTLKKYVQQFGRPDSPKPVRIGLGGEPYKDTSDLQLEKWIVVEADKLTELETKSDKKWSQLPIEARISSFTDEFNDCCAQDIRELRTEALRRLGLDGKFSEEVNLWRCLFPTDVPATDSYRTVDPTIVREYIPQFRRLGVMLQRISIPAHPPLTLNFDQKQEQGKRSFPYGIAVTVAGEKPITHGCVVVTLSDKPASIASNFNVGIDRPIVNKELKRALAEYDERKIVIFVEDQQIDTSHPIYLEIMGKNPLQVTSAVLYDE